ncbi:MAG: hypothetical protein ACQEWW_26210 [Bacillota bacterium]
MFKYFPICPYFIKRGGRGKFQVKMTKEKAQSLAKRGIEHSKKYGIPLKQKKKK